ncbi:MAG: hypothetical protein KatS3mg108_0872 [Isosphaeraceae bacterium]|jgi:hypothetical protein|nr:MAG: hypothetical protein KatS3mg108_0872 [Isosphaeraceae bacterium]
MRGSSAAFGAAVGASVVLHLALAWPLFTGEIYTYDDLTRFHLPMRLVYARALAQGHDPAWVPDIYAGFPLQGEAQVGMSHPWHGLLYRLAPLPLAFMLELVVSYPLLQWGMYRLLRLWPLDRGAAAVGSLQFAFCGSLVMRHVHMNMVAALAHVPWLLWAMDHQLRGRRWWAGPLVALLTTSQLLVGHPQSVVYSLMIEGVYVVVLLGSGVKPVGLVGWLVAKVLGLLGGSVQVVPLMVEVGRSVRSEVVMSLGISRPEHGWNVVQWVAPYLFRARGYFPEAAPKLGHYTHEAAIYMGCVAPVMLGLLSARRRFRSECATLVWGMAALVVGGVILTFVEATPLIDLYRKIPVVRLFRVSARYFVLVQFGVAVLVAVGFDGLISGRLSVRGRDWFVMLVPALLGVVGVVGFWLAALGPRPEDLRLLAPMEQAALGVGLLILGAIAVGVAGQGHGWGAVAVVLLMAGDLGGYGLSFVRAFPVERYESFVAKLPHPPAANPGYRIRMGGLPIERATDVMVLAGHWLVDGYAGLIPRRVLDFDTLAAARVAGVGWSLEYGQGADRRVRWTAIGDPLPRARLLTDVVVSDDPAGQWAWIDPKTVAVVPEAIALDGGSPGTATIVRDEPGRIEVEAESAGRQLLVVAERIHEGWRAEVDGEPAAVLPVYGEFMGVVVKPGRHRVALRFDPESYRVGRWVTLGALCVVGIWALGAGYNAWRRSPINR